MKYSDIPKDRLDALSPDDRQNLKKLSRKLEQAELDAQAVGKILPEAVMLGEKPQNRVSKSMVEVTEKAITFSIARDPEKLSTALFPIIGTAIKKAINRMMSEMMTALNTSMENMFSYNRMAWRIESIKTGIPFMEIVMKNSMLYRVEHVLLIHRKSSLLLHHISMDDSFPTDSDIVASMLRAVQDYIKDSLALEGDETVHTISTGEYTILIEDGPQAILAAVVKGVVDADLPSRMLASLEAVHVKLAAELASFAGDTGPFEEEEALLRPCLVNRMGPEKKKPVYAIILLSFLFIVFSILGVFMFQSARIHRGFIAELNREPGILVASEMKKFRGYELRVLQDSRSRSIDRIAQSQGVNLNRYDLILEEFISPFYGAINRGAGTGIPEEMMDLSRELQGYILFFEQDSGTFRNDQQALLSSVVQLIKQIFTLSKDHGVEVRIEIVGHSAGSVQDADSIQVSQERAGMVYSLLEENLSDFKEQLLPMGVGIGSPVVEEEKNEEDRLKNRSVTFNVIFE
ncbi:hypothetical protein EXM22_11005 [Oceanispirochaeta crateris]|uniref:OmpA-like domain-containing protein n=1 Tax=Oceanispirochaeta crateris TaxID=2518645 RepID=A0A5C1QMP4_9SPIO|nr:OmpA family protein [Oceanispirochaeta crateris]QEN08489.1 hypothetical protein EXM22_11005 [Oceanispirochaeta crateris]